MGLRDELSANINLGPSVSNEVARQKQLRNQKRQEMSQNLMQAKRMEQVMDGMQLSGQQQERALASEYAVDLSGIKAHQSNNDMQMGL
jgi:hypothetical protein